MPAVQAREEPTGFARQPAPQPTQAPQPRPTATAPKPANDRPPASKGTGDFQPSRAPDLSERYIAARDIVFEDIRQGVDVTSLVRLDRERARQDIETAVETIINFRRLDLTASEQFSLSREVCDDILGYGPLEPLLARDDIADIMVNGPETVYIETEGKISQAPIRFRDNQHLINICQKIVSAVGRRIDESSPICDARLPDGSRVNAIIPPLAVDGATLTIRKFKQEKLTLEKLMEYGSVDQAAATVLRVAAASRCNILISGGTGSGKTTMLNCLTGYISHGERVITCEDACELQLQQPHVVRLETRPPNLEGEGEVLMRDLVKNCLRMRPDRIIVGEVRGPEAFDLLQAMNTGHDGSMGTIHANNPREGLSRVENMIAMGNISIPPAAIREQIAAAINVVVQCQRLRDGSRRVTHITEVAGMEGDVVTLQDLVRFEVTGEDRDGNLVGRHVATGLRPKFWEKARYYGLHGELLEALEAAH
ncbi:MAG: Flp pilus assembly complex ATPase component TadA [Alphaproteobacteria bacterium]|nr:Flp pilus assembly complex ATPase component TadA [Alphaproteobacteria bacterium SS10]